MLIKLSLTKSDRRDMTKIIQDETPIEGTLRNETSVINPDILIEIENPTSFNYMYIPDFHRYYFINDMEHIRNDLWRIKAHVDVLQTYANEIFASDAIIDKSADNQENKYIGDDTWVPTVKTKTDILSFPSGLSETGTFLLMAAGG